MPGLIRGVARTAVVAGTATGVSNRVSRRQAARWGAQAPDPYEQPATGYPPQDAQAASAPPAGRDPVEQLTELAALKERGVLTDDEFAAQKAKILNA
jgi:hypothetical protein